MAERNKHGLGRYVPQDVRREVRRRCGFGCVICGLAYYDYEHFNPDFKDAMVHDPKGMTLLCMQCNQKRARGTLSSESVAKANANPRCKQDGFASELFDIGQDPVEVRFASSIFIGCETILQISGVKVLSLKPPTEPGMPFLLSGIFSDSSGSTTLRIEDNVWYAGDENWDVEVSGPRITIRRELFDVALQIKVEPPRVLIIERIDLEIEGVRFRGGENSLKYTFDGVNWNSMSGNRMKGAPVAINFE
ncbi:HNH endonuclease [Pseudomonas putida]|uniref:HNH endonuclease n=1 Tax=Pseudomonas putida TaxID=303 RepID=A0A1Q9R2F6_PSEPU|nr:HNH endonuclease [Pseudomonas putida]OLS61561.1 hypothetical protein PSEMO_36280 [Pseudomonas putida]